LLRIGERMDMQIDFGRWPWPGKREARVVRLRLCPGHLQTIVVAAR